MVVRNGRSNADSGDGYSVLVHNMNYHIYPSDLSDLFRGIGGLYYYTILLSVFFAIFGN